MECRVLEKGKCEITQGYSDNHKAVDIVGSNYTLDYVVAHSDGKIVFFQDGLNNDTNSSGNASYGNCVKIDHGNGYATLYAHMQKGLLVRNGEYVKKGQKLGYMGNTGRAFGLHLHLEVRKNNERINPIEYLNSDLPMPQPTKSNEELAEEVIAGKYGNGEDRKNALGDRYDEVQALVNDMLKPKVNYLKCDYDGVSIVDGLKSIGVDSSFSYRSKLASANGISNYRGTADQNTQLLNLLKNGELKQA